MRLSPEASGAACTADVIVAGNICLDVIPDLGKNGLDALLVPGKLVHAGEAVLSTGGAVSNTGLALHRLGMSTRLMAKVGGDLFGRAILDGLGQYGSGLEKGIIVQAGEQTSYSIVVSPDGTDRIFWHSPGTNDTFSADDVDYDSLGSARLFHFGYPPSMKRMYNDEGRELERLLSRAKARGLTTSLDMSRPDPGSPAGQVDWRALLARILPHVDLFLPSFEETLFMLDRSRFDEWIRQGDGELLRQAEGELLAELSGQLLHMGAAVVVVKLGDQGLYVRTSEYSERWPAMGRSKWKEIAAWSGREMLVPCFDVQVAGTTGAGDCTIAGFLSGFLHGLSLEETITCAAAVGACSVEAMDSISGIPSWFEVRERIDRGWERRPVSIALPSWNWDERTSIWIGPYDAK